MSSNNGEPSDPKKIKRRRRINGFEEWGGYMPAKKAKLEAQFKGQEPIELPNERTTEIFKGISIFVNGYTKPPAEELKRLMRLHGGTYHHYYSHSKTTHIIASNLPNTKINKLKKEIVVTADWIMDSIKAGKLLATYKYVLYSPEFKDKQNKLCFKNAVINEDKEISVSPDLSPDDLTKLPLDGECLKNIVSNEISSDEFVSSPPCFESEESPPVSQKVDIETNSKQPENIIELPLFTAKASAVTSNSTLHKNEPVLTAVHPEFLSEFYSRSRLHHISTGGQELKRYVQHLLDSKKDFTGREKLKNLVKESCPSFTEDLLLQEPCSSKIRDKSLPIIMHLDMDCFFVSVGLRKYPKLIGVPVAVTHSKGRRGGPQEGSDIHYEASHYANQSEKKVKGLTAINEEDDFQVAKPNVSIYSKEYGSLSEIASCSYEARKAGLRNGMFLGEALRRCPNLKMIPYDFDGYTEVSKQLYDIVSSYTLEIEAVSVDELYIDCTDLLKETQVAPLHFASLLRNEIFEKTKCSASAGLGSNMLIARLATKMAKPNGQYLVQDSEVEEFMKKQKVENLPGVGYRMAKKFKLLGIDNCAELQNLSLNKLQQEFGPKTGESVYNKCRGKDNRKVQAQKDRKSVSAEINYGIRFETNEDVAQFINELAVEVQNRLQNINCKGKAITLKLMVRRPDAPVETAKFMGHGVCDNVSKSIVLKSATDSSKVIGNECCALAQALKINSRDYRGVGIQVSKLEQVQKEESAHKTLKSFFKHDGNVLKPIQSDLKSPNKAATTSKFSPQKNSIRNLLTKPSKKVTYDLADYIPEQDLKSPNKAATTSKVSPLKNSIRNLLTKPSIKVTYDLADYIPEQLDQSVLNALPEDLKKEILENCAKPSVNQTTIKSNKPSGSLSSPISKSKEIQKKGFKLNTISDHSSSVSRYLNSKPSTSAQILSDVIEEERTISNDNICFPKAVTSPKGQKKRIIEFFITWGEKEKEISPENGKSANLGGAIELDDVRKLLKEWILNTEAPLDEDIEELKQFLLDSIDYDLSKVSLLLKYFYRLACSHGPLWKEAYLSILSYVQQKMLQNYGAMISVNSDFPT